jgi:hypothetical protein
MALSTLSMSMTLVVRAPQFQPGVLAPSRLGK